MCDRDGRAPTAGACTRVEIDSLTSSSSGQKINGDNSCEDDLDHFHFGRDPFVGRQPLARHDLLVKAAQGLYEKDPNDEFITPDLAIHVATDDLPLRGAGSVTVREVLNWVQKTKTPPTDFPHDPRMWPALQDLANTLLAPKP